MEIAVRRLFLVAALASATLCGSHSAWAAACPQPPTPPGGFAGAPLPTCHNRAAQKALAAGRNAWSDPETAPQPPSVNPFPDSPPAPHHGTD